MADENAAVVAEAPEIDVDALPDEDFQKLKRGEEVAPKAKAEPKVEAKADEAEEDDDEEPAEGKPQGKSETVPYGKFHRVNERAKAEAKARADAEARANLAMQRMTALLEASNPKAAEEPEIDLGPDPLEDPVGYMAWDREQKRAQALKAREYEQQAAQQRDQQQVWNEAVNTATAQFNAAKTENPAIEDAYNAVRESIGRELQALGWRGPQLVQKLHEAEAQYIVYAHQNQIPITDLIVQLAEARVGWQPTKTEKPAEQTDRDAAGRFAKAAADLEKREATKAAAKSLNGTGGSPVAGEKLTPEDIVNMSDEDFAAFKKKFGGSDKSLATALASL